MTRFFAIAPTLAAILFLPACGQGGPTKHEMLTAIDQLADQLEHPTHGLWTAYKTEATFTNPKTSVSITYSGWNFWINSGDGVQIQSPWQNLVLLTEAGCRPLMNPDDGTDKAFCALLSKEKWAELLGMIHGASKKFAKSI
ncbi:hypothetical protein A3D62_02550 [Candidatus Kaiserbacteria bacterium RIFCSPHIGHO2_02_FULL_49_11]|uniref:Uncharacterized protein n=1 Tax=Candidatus Kaiserbacteria bacterium RIFCSPHIGHO2_02_FULL_49_11 TaxID=1798489 RepID=A0A1F6D0U1_9BACT|nr:MAG: hypothetical protein A3D62_02550 [Candidatus Kaiserbacteria bacterium RIFCSPHIGHO2_02_FULL_49_11]